MTTRLSTTPKSINEKQGENIYSPPFMLNTKKNIDRLVTGDIAELLNKIENEESLKGKLPELKWTHRTDLYSLEKILDSGYIGSYNERGVNFFLGKGAGYGDVQLIMKDSVKELNGAPALKKENLESRVVKTRKNMIYFFGKYSKGFGMDEKEYTENFGDFRKYTVNQHINAPYLFIGGQNGQKSKMPHSVGIDHIEAVMLPKHLKQFSYYNSIIAKLKNMGIKVIEMNTSESILDYAGGSILNYEELGQTGSLIKKELERMYPDIKTNEDKIVKFFRDKGIIGKDKDVDFEYFKRYYNDSLAIRQGLSRGKKIVGGQFQNYVGFKADIIEQKEYFKYLVESRYEE